MAKTKPVRKNKDNRQMKSFRLHPDTMPHLKSVKKELKKSYNYVISESMILDILIRNVTVDKLKRLIASFK